MTGENKRVNVAQELERSALALAEADLLQKNAVK